MSATEKVKKLMDFIRSGKTVYIQTATRCTKIDKKCLTKFEKGGHTLLKAVKDSVYMASGSKFVCINYCKITVA